MRDLDFDNILKLPQTARDGNDLDDLDEFVSLVNLARSSGQQQPKGAALAVSLEAPPNY